MLQMKDAAYAYGAGRGVDGISLEIARVLAPQRGEILFEGKREWDAKEYARRVAYLPQETEATFPMRAIDVVVSGRAPYLGRFDFESGADYAEAEKALAICDASHLAERDLDELGGGHGRCPTPLPRRLTTRPAGGCRSRPRA